MIFGDYLDEDVDLPKLIPLTDLISEINKRTDVFYWIAGGAVRDCFSGDKINDIDVWFKTKVEAEAFILNLNGRNDPFKEETSTSLTFSFYGRKIQAIFREELFFKTAKDLIESFDIRACCMSIDRFKSFCALDGACVDEAKDKEIDVWSDSRPANTLLRITRLSRRGWNVEENQIKELLELIILRGYDIGQLEEDFYRS